jgi:hypothetical protein
VDRRKLKFTNFKHNYKPGLALEINSSPKERAKINHKQMKQGQSGAPDQSSLRFLLLLSFQP